MGIKGIGTATVTMLDGTELKFENVEMGIDLGENGGKIKMAKKEKVELGKCCERVHSGYQIYDCSKPGKVVEDGKVYCGIHNPERARKRNEIAEAKREIKEDKREKQNNLALARSNVLTCCKIWYKGGCDGRALSKRIKELLKAEDKL